MSKPKSKGLRARAAHALNKVLGSPPPTALPSGPSTPGTTSVRLSNVFGLQALPAQPVSTHPSPVTSTQVPVLHTPSLHIPPALQPHQAPSPSSGIAWAGLDTVLRNLHTNTALFPPLQSVIGELQSGFAKFEASTLGFTKNKKECETLARELKTMSETLDRHLQGLSAPPMMDFIVGTVQLIQEQVDLLAKVQNSDQTQRLAKTQQVEKALTECDRQIQMLCRQLQLNAGLSAATEQQNAQLEKINPARLAAYDSRIAMEVSRRACTENTRTGVLSNIRGWLDDPKAPNVCWMNGMAGTGKTTIAYTLAQTLSKDKRLAASFFCTRTMIECRDVAQIVPTIAYQFARYSPTFLSALCGALRDDPDILSCTISKQFEEILKAPLLEVKDAIPTGLVIVIDALDECTASDGVKLVLDMLLREAPNLPLKFFVTSRPESSIRSRIQEQPEGSRSIFELHNVRQSDVQADIELYLQAELPSIAYPRLKQLAKLCGSLFIYAATAVRYIRAGNMEDRLTRTLSAGSGSRKGHAEIDKLYSTILLAAFDKDVLEEDEEERMKFVLWTAVCAREPMSVQTLAALTRIRDSQKVLEALDPLRSVLYVSEDGSVVSTLHASFPDYMCNPARSSSFTCNLEQHDEFLTRRCFELMQEQLQFNICGLESSYILDEEVPDLQDRVDKAISPALAYACRYWANHLQKSPTSDGLHALLKVFFAEHLLFRMEVMNLKHWIRLGIRAMLAAKLWLLAKDHTSKLAGFAEDARRFVTSFTANVVSQSTPHIYISALPFCFRSSAVYRNYRKKVRCLIEPKGKAMETRYETVIAKWVIDPSPLRAIAYSPDGTWIAVGCDNGSIVVGDAHDGTPVCAPFKGHTLAVSSIAFSPDGRRTVSASEDGTIRVWNVEDGTLVSAPSEDRIGSVSSVAFSPDGTHIVSGSGDRTIRIWNVEDGTPVGAPFRGHTAPITSVAFSPDGARVVSGSLDNTIRMWNAEDGTPSGAPFEGHTDSVTSVAFSPDCTRIVSGSDDSTIRMWNAEDGTPIGAPFKGHTSSVTSVTFSLDCACIASGSSDGTIQMWNAEDGTPAGTPFEGHTYGVFSVAFSPDGKRLVSGSYDDTVRVWSCEDDTLAGAPPQGHTDWVTSVAFSPNGSRIVSSSKDNTIRMWDAEDGTPIGAPFKGHTSSVTSVAFSPDGTRIASGSRDTTIRMWNTKDGSPVGSPFEGHTASVMSVAFSPNGTRCVSSCRDKTIRLWDAENGTPVGAPFEGHTGFVYSLAFSPDGTSIASGSSDKTIRIWNARDGTPIGAPFQGHTEGITSVAFSPDGAHIVSGSWDRTIRIWHTEGGTPVGTHFKDDVGYVASVAFSPDGARIVSGSHDNTIQMWDAKDGTLIGAPFEGYYGPVMSVAFSPDGTRIVSGSLNKTIRMWNVEDDPRVGATFEGLTDLTASVASVPEGTRMVPDSGDDTSDICTDEDDASVDADGWFVAEDGWVEYNSHLLIWVPPDLTPYLPTPRNPWVIGPHGVIYLDYTGLQTSSDWRTCYTVPTPEVEFPGEVE